VGLVGVDQQEEAFLAQRLQPLDGVLERLLDATPRLAAVGLAWLAELDRAFLLVPGVEAAVEVEVPRDVAPFGEGCRADSLEDPFGVPSGQDRGHAGQGPGGRRDDLLEAHPLRGQGVQTRGGRALVPVAAEMVGPHRVQQDQHHAPGPVGSSTAGAGQERPEHERPHAQPSCQ
jgi:hypothetical protein